MEKRDYSQILVESADGVARVTLNREARRNAIGPTMVNELLYALEDAHASEAVRSIVITGAGKAFCAGGDFSQMSGGDSAEALPPKGDYKDLLLALLATTKPIIARVNGHAMGGGLGIVACCTFGVASAEAKLGTPEINVGLFPFMIMAVLERIVPRRRLVEMMLCGERLSAEEAAEVGLINRAVRPAELDRQVAHYTSAVQEKSPVAIRLGMQAIRETEGMSLEEKLPDLSRRLMECLATDDAREGLSAFLEKRDPVWTGR